MLTLVSAIKNKVDFLVTGDKRHFQKLKLPGDYSFKIVTPSEFIDIIFPEVLKEIEKKFDTESHLRPF